MKNESLRNLFSEEAYRRIKFEDVRGRYVTNSSLQIAMDALEDEFKVEDLGKSVLGKSIYAFKLGTGKINILMWSQMHGNESTTTKAVFDLLHAFKIESNNHVFSYILENCTICMIPILNPDGAEAYTRVNANSVDLNRDLQNLSQPESQILKNLYDEFQPHFCLNLHDQRTIFSAGDNAKPATLSFLTPSKDAERSIDHARKQSMSLVSGIVKDLSEDLSFSIGRYDDAFNMNCAGDTFQNLGTPTVLFEAGHFKGDYEREETRKYVYKALLSCLFQISQETIKEAVYEDYFKIPENRKLFNDVIIRRASLNGKIIDISIQFKETLKDQKIQFIPIIEKISPQIVNYGHKEIDAEENVISLLGNSEILENVVVNKFILNGEELAVYCG